MSGKKTGSKKAKGARKAHRKAVNTDQNKAGLDSILNKAEKLFSKGKFNSVLESLNQLDPEKLNTKDLILYYRLKAFAGCQTNDLVEAEKAAQAGLKLSDNDRDFLFALAFIYTSYKDSENTLKFAGQYIKEIDSDRSKKKSPYLSNGREHLVYNYLGVAYRSKGDLEKAEKEFLRALELNPKDNHVYLNLAGLYRQQKKYTEAEEIIERGLKSCSQIQELRLLKKTLAQKNSVSACMIVKNEEKLLPNCLESIRSWVDEIIVVDTGSTDRTVEIAESYGAKVYHQEWKNDFSYHRNYSMSLAQSDWIFIIDADEEFVPEHFDELWYALGSSDYNLVSINVFNIDPQTGEQSSFIPSVRFVRRSSGYKYDGIVHNQLIYSDDEVIPRTKVSIRHYGYNLTDEEMEKKYERSYALLEKQIEEDPENAFAHFNLAQLLRGYKRADKIAHNEKIIYHASKAVEFSNTDPKDKLAIYLQGYHQQITSLYNLRRFEEAERLCREVLRVKPDYIDAVYTYGIVSAAMFKVDQAENALKKYLELNDAYQPEKEIMNIILLYVNRPHKAYYNLAQLRSTRRDYDAALDYYFKALETMEPLNDTYGRIASIYLDKGEIDKANEYIQKELKLHPDTDYSHLLQARYCGLNGDGKQAAYHLTEALRLTEGNGEIYERSGIYFIANKEYDKAIGVYQKLIELSPHFEPAYRRLAECHFALGEYDKAAEYYYKIAERAPADKSILNDLAGCYYQMSDYENAEKYYAAALGDDSTYALGYRNLGLTKFNLNKLDEARTYLEKYLETNSEDIDIAKIIGIICLQQGDFTASISIFEQVLQKNSRDMEALFYISEGYFASGYTDSAAVGYKKILEIDPDFEPALEKLKRIETEKVSI